MSKQNSAGRKANKIFSNIFLTLSIVVLLAAVVFVLTGTNDRFIFGYKPFIIATGSMEPEYLTNSIVIISEDAYEELEVGDVIAFKPEQLGGAGAMHRIVESTDQGFITKGDNNDFADDGTVTLENYVGRAIWHTNALAGYFDKLMKPNGVLKFLVLPLGGIILLIIAIKLLLPTKEKQDPASGASQSPASSQEESAGGISFEQGERSDQK